MLHQIYNFISSLLCFPTQHLFSAVTLCLKSDLCRSSRGRGCNGDSSAIAMIRGPKRIGTTTKHLLYMAKVITCRMIFPPLICMLLLYTISYPIISYPILSYPILSYPILSYPILSYPILSSPLLSSPLLSSPLLSSPLLFAILFCFVSYDFPSSHRHSVICPLSNIQMMMMFMRR